MQIAQEIDKCEELIVSVTGQRPHLFRPPSGLVNGTVQVIASKKTIKQSSGLSVLIKQGYRFVTVTELLQMKPAVIKEAKRGMGRHEHKG